MPGRCHCPRALRERYAERISGPLKDRFDLLLRVEPVDPAALLAVPPTPDEATRSVESALERQQARARALGLTRPWNSRIPGHLLPGAVEVTAEAQAHLIALARLQGHSARGMHRILRVARTIADLEDHDEVTLRHVSVASGYRVGA